MVSPSRLLGLLLALLFLPWIAQADDPRWINLTGGHGIGKGKKIVLMAGDEEYRSEEALPMLGQILTTHHGFDCTVLFSIDTDGKVAPKVRNNTPGIEALDHADLLVIATRFRELPSDQMKHVVDYLRKGKPVIGLRTATHAFIYPADSPFAKLSHDYAGADFEGGFGRQILGERWVAHHGDHGSESTLGRIVDPKHPILTGIEDGQIWGPTDVYAVRLPLPPDCHVLVEGEVLQGMDASSPPVDGPKNKPRMPIAWTKNYHYEGGAAGKVFTTTMGASQDFQNPGLRRLFVNACLWCLDLEDKITPDLAIDPVGQYAPTPFGFDKFQSGKLPSEFLPLP
jgi:type 1 glutamine amidotransferase